jgi:hypothetical protein
MNKTNPPKCFLVIRFDYKDKKVAGQNNALLEYRKNNKEKEW